MMRKSTKIVSVALAAAMVMGVATACGNGGSKTFNGKYSDLTVAAFNTERVNLVVPNAQAMTDLKTKAGKWQYLLNTDFVSTTSSDGTTTTTDLSQTVKAYFEKTDTSYKEYFESTSKMKMNSAGVNVDTDVKYTQSLEDKVIYWTLSVTGEESKGKMDSTEAEVQEWDGFGNMEMLLSPLWVLFSNTTPLTEYPKGVSVEIAKKEDQTNLKFTLTSEAFAEFQAEEVIAVKEPVTLFLCYDANKNFCGAKLTLDLTATIVDFASGTSKATIEISPYTGKIPTTANKESFETGVFTPPSILD